MTSQPPYNFPNGPGQDQRPFFNPAATMGRPPAPTRPPLPNGYPSSLQGMTRPPVPAQGLAFSPMPLGGAPNSLPPPLTAPGGSSPRPPMGRPPSTPVLSPNSSEPPSNRTSTNPSPVSTSRFDQLEGQFLPPSGATSPAGSSTNLYAMNQDPNVPYPYSMQVNGTNTPQAPSFTNTSRPPSSAPNFPPTAATPQLTDPRWAGSPYRPQMGPPPPPGSAPPLARNPPFPHQFQTQQATQPAVPPTDPRTTYPQANFVNPVAPPQFNYGQAVDNLTPQMGNLSVTQAGYDKLWGRENIDLLQVRHIMPSQVETPKIQLKQEHLNAYNCSPDIFRSTLNKIPETANLLKKAKLPLGLLIHPFKDLTQLPVIQCQTIVRCRACRTYINPFVYFVDQRRWKCNLCFRINDLPDEFQYDPISKTYGDPSRRPEVKNATIEYIAPAEYMLRPPQPAVYLYVLDVCHHAIDTGYLKLFCDVLLEELERIPGDSRTQIGFITFDSSVHFYRMAEGFSQPHQLIVSDIDDIFLPCPNDLLVNLSENKQLITDLLEQLPSKFNNNPHTSSALGAALQAAYKLVSPTGGRVTVFQTCLPNAGPGALKSREDPNQRSSKDVPHLNPATDFYKSLALECCGQQVGVDLFLLGSQYMDVASLSCISQYSGGCIHHFPGFHYMHNPVQSERLERSFRRYLTRKIGFEAVMRVRCTRGLSIHTFHGNFFVRSTDLLSLPNINPDAGFGLQVSIEESLTDVQNVCFQAALLYTSSKGERRIRVHTICLPITGSVIEAIHSADQQCIVGLLAKMAVDRSLQSSISDARDASVNVCIDVLSAYKAAQSGSYGLNAPGSLRLLPVYVSALLKTVALRTGLSTRLDDRVFAMTQFKTLPLAHLLQVIYPDLYAIHNLTDQGAISVGDMVVAQPPRLSLTAEKVDSNGAYILDTGDVIYLFVGRDVGLAFLQNALGVNAVTALPEHTFELPELETPESERLRNFMTHLQNQKPYPGVIQIAVDNNQSRSQFFSRLVEDRTESSLSYYEFLQHLKNQIK